MSDIEAMIASSRLVDQQRDLALRVFRRLGRRGSQSSRNDSQNKVHFHEVGVRFDR
ncbi:MAG: nickel insertion protein [Pirellulaceae bacterium]